MRKIDFRLLMLAIIILASVNAFSQETTSGKFYLVWTGYTKADGQGDVVKTDKLPFFASRGRTAKDISDAVKGVISDQYFTAAFKVDNFWKHGIQSIRYHVVNAAGENVAGSWDGHTYYQLAQANTTNGTTANNAKAKDDNESIVIYEEYGTHVGGNDFLLNLGTKDAPASFSTTTKTVDGHSSGNVETGSWSIAAARSFTIFYNTKGGDKNNSYAGSVTLNVNGSIPEDPDKSFYIIGNLANAVKDGDWDPYKTVDGVAVARIKMVRTVYPIGIKDESQADSVVYTATVNRPSNGWGDFYLSVAPYRLLKNNKSFSEDTYYGWRHIFRPQVDPYEVNGISQLDGTAPYGVLYASGTTQPYDYAALNPKMVDGENLTSFTFSMNITYSTYRITFHKGLYIIGDAIKGWDEGKGVLMDYNADIKGWEKEVTFTKEGGYFRFAQDEHMLDCYGENGVSPLEPNTDNEAVAGGDGALETQYANKLSWYNENTLLHKGITTPLSGEGTATYGDIQFRLPAGTYKVRFYANPITGKGNDTGDDRYNIYYTIDRSFKFYAPEKLNGNLKDADNTEYKTYRAFSNFHRMTNPDPSNIDVYIVTEATATSGTYGNVKLTKVDGTYIPAGTGVILASKSTAAATKGTDVAIDICTENPWAAPENVSDNLLKAAVVGKQIAKQLDGAYTLRFGWKKINDTDSAPTLGFYPQAGTAVMNPNTAYLPFTPTSTSSSAAAPAMRLMIDYGTTTGIDQVERHTGKAASNLYYTLQGVATTSPAAPGIYIHGGKKVVIK